MENNDSDGVPLGSIGYLIGTYPDGAYEVDFSAPDGTTIAQLVLEESEMQLAECSVPVTGNLVAISASATQRITHGRGKQKMKIKQFFVYPLRSRFHVRECCGDAKGITQLTVGVSKHILGGGSPRTYRPKRVLDSSI